MGLTISYTLSTNREMTKALLLPMVEQTAQSARKMGCLQVIGPDVGGPEFWKMWKLPDGSTTGKPLSPLEGWSVGVLPGEGSEPAYFGLCRYPGIKGWRLSSWCKTQYAARHGIENFLSAHRRVISLLDLWRDFGVDMDVCDEGEYWQSRSVEQLTRRVGLYDRLVAAVSGAVKDDPESNHSLSAEILKDPRFERLEAEGREQFAAQIAELQKALRDVGRSE
jgi:hypothetical protein